MAFFLSTARTLAAPLGLALLASCTQAAPEPPPLNLGLQTRLIDIIDCTDPKDPHPFKDQGTSSIIDGPAGRYRVTAAHRHAFFSYRFKTAGKDQPVWIVIEYPDDARRLMSFMTHDSTRPGQPHVSFSQEGGVYTGEPYPVSNAMRYFTYLSWPQDDESPLIVVNFDDRKARAAASRIWVYAVEGMQPPAIAAPASEQQRFVDLFFPLAFLATRDNFGWKSPQSPQHLADYCKLTGVNRVTLTVYANQSWGAMVTIPAWDAKEPDSPWTLDSVLQTFDRAGGLGLVAGIVATGRTESGINGMYGTIKSGGRDLNAMPPDELKATVLRGLDEFLERYGRYRSLQGLALGSMETIGFWELLQDRGILADVVAHVKQRRPDLMVQTFFGNGYLQRPYFDGQRYAKTEAQVLAEWEQAGGHFGDFVGDEAMRVWRQPPYRHDPALAKGITGLTTFQMYHPDDPVLHLQYRFQPRSPLYHDVARSQRLSDLAGLDHAAIFASFTEGQIGLHRDVNFWHDKLWTAPDMNPPGPLARAALARALGHRDRLGLSLGAWTVKTFGWEPHLQRFITAYRALPPEPMIDVPSADHVKVRWLPYQGKRYVSAVSLIPFESTVTIDGQTVALEPYDLVTKVDNGSAAPQVAGEAPVAYRAFVADRLAGYRRLHAQLRALDPAAAPDVYLKPAAEAERLLAEGRPQSADLALAWGLERELALRRDILQRPEIAAPRIAAPPLNGDLNAWPAAAADIAADRGDLIPAHTYFTNSWSGPDDLSMRIRLGHDGQRLFVGVEVRDSVADAGDQVTIRLSPARYRDWRSESANFETQWTIARPTGPAAASKTGPFSYSAAATAAGYRVEGSVGLAELGLAPGGAIGFQVALADKDQTPNLAKHSWAVKQAMLYPHEPNFAFWQDARTVGKLVLAP